MIFPWDYCQSLLSLIIVNYLDLGEQATISKFVDVTKLGCIENCTDENDKEQGNASYRLIDWTDEV